MLISNATFAILATQGHSPTWLTIAVTTEQVTSGLGLTVFAVYLSGLTNLAFTATQFALLSSVAVVGRTWLSTPSGYAAEALGWPGFWLLTMVVALPGMLLLWVLWSRGFVVDAVRQPGAEVPDKG
jgi:PAT family beta-lactamase induction signal transducer AmpG